MNWHVTTLTMIKLVRKELVHEIIQREAPGLKDTCFSVLCKDYICGVQRCCRTNCNTFFAR
jgi:hypothetical protein